MGHQWLRPDDICPCFLFNTVDKGWNARNTMCPVESPMQGNNWRPTQPDGGERPTFYFPKILLSNINAVSKHDAQRIGALRSSPYKLKINHDT